MNLYDNYRVRTPMKRTNPEKGLGIDPKWVPISWKEAVDILVEKLDKVKKDDPRKLVVSSFDTYGITHWAASWLEAFGTPTCGLSISVAVSPLLYVPDQWHIPL